MPARTFESEIVRRYDSLGLAEPAMRWAPNPERFDAMLAEARVEAVLASHIGVEAMREARCLCPVCLGLDITTQITPFAPTLGNRRRLALVDAVADTAGATRALSIAVHAGGSESRFSERPESTGDDLAWASAWDGVGDDALSTAGVDAWACTPHACVILEAGAWSYDEDGWLNDDAETPALVWPDGWSASFERGVHIPQWASDPEQLTVERINKIDNVELRRILAGRLGYDWYVANNRLSRMVDEDPLRGQLWDLGRDWSGQQPRLLRVLDATPTPVGDRKVYWLNVPPRMRTAQEAVAWTFGLESDGYAPEVET